MNIRTNKLINKNKHRNIAVITLTLTFLFFFIAIKELRVSGKQEMFWGLSSALSALAFFIMSLVTAGIATSSFLKYKLEKESFILQNIQPITTVGVILIILIISWRLIVLILSQSISIFNQFSFIELLIFGIGIILIVLGIFRKRK